MVECHYTCTVTVTSWLYSDVAIPNQDVTVAFFLYRAFATSMWKVSHCLLMFWLGISKIIVTYALGYVFATPNLNVLFILICRVVDTFNENLILSLGNVFATPKNQMCQADALIRLSLGPT